MGYNMKHTKERYHGLFYILLCLIRLLKTNNKQVFAGRHWSKTNLKSA